MFYILNESDEKISISIFKNLFFDLYVGRKWLT